MNYHLTCINKIAIISSISFESPLQELAEIAMKLQENHYEGKVIFDLLCSNGNESNRFIFIKFNGSRFDHASFQTIERPDVSLVKVQNKFYKENHKYIASSVLSDMTKYEYM